ncbi:hypothetical protein M3664_05830 [Paenibacillus lautus]|uniref:hypothetical protein n=1 Tax=Paenibacillus lautus TaxID=1401 RepID=UPI002041E174|nr:hypothetical protein [Paenibacillus lautus]MCM3257305.1 hypothetical protein [Paenibacillus lautus]
MNEEVKMRSLGLSQSEIKLFKNKKVEFNKLTGTIMKKSRADAKRLRCYICNTECSSFCNSHSVPRFCLDNIAIDGRLLYSGNLIDSVMFDKPKGINEAGTFKIICNDCDSKVFKDYENPENYFKEPNDKMLSQMAMKNYLKNISKRELENALYPNIEQLPGEFVEYIHSINELDLKEYVMGFEYSKKATVSKWNDHFYLAYFESLDYVVPIAFQNCVSLIADFEGNTINDIYNSSQEYLLSEMHISVLPFKDHSVVLFFIKNEEKRYRTFLRQFKKLTIQEKLKVINYIIFSYSEDIFIYKGLDKEILENEELRKVAQQTNVAEATTPFANSLEEAKRVFDLLNRNSIPNLLDKSYKVR